MSQNLCKLCRRCRVLRFNDLALGDQMVVSENREGKLELPLDEPGLEGCGNIPLDYKLSDKFPELPKLMIGARSRCSFCQLLSDAIKEYAAFDGEPEIEITMKYRWSQSNGGKVGLTGLFVYFVSKSTILDQALPLCLQSRPLRFLIDGNAGKYKSLSINLFT